MPKIDVQPIPKDDKAAALAAITAYKQQNPVKYEQKKEALFARYGLSPKEEKEIELDDNDRELEAIKKKVTKSKTKKNG